MSELKYYDVTVNGRRQAVYLKGDVDEYVDQLEEANATLKREKEQQAQTIKDCQGRIAALSVHLADTQEPA